MDEPDLTKREFQELLPFYVNGTIVELQRRRIDAYLALHPDAIKDVHLLQAARSSLQAEYKNMDPLEGYSAFKERLDQRRIAHAAVASIRDPEKTTLIQRWNAFVEGIKGWGMVPAIAMLIVAVAIPAFLLVDQKTVTGDESSGRSSGVLADLLADRQIAGARNAGRASIRSLKDDRSKTVTGVEQVAPSAAKASVTYLYVVFKPEATFSQVVILLRENHCQIYDGPSRTGELKVEVDISDPKISALLVKERLAASSLVMRVGAQPSNAK